ncbi:glycoside hydrolase family 2 TIM barrel-domain containing protein [Niabella hirudinis]|uniref:glycoside hydrolase family 2 TIM barrel-domain containing protein n=1 Tax=Niabella hirudinis TaxID=1285929 RepID=UPI003EBBACC0
MQYKKVGLFISTLLLLQVGFAQRSSFNGNWQFIGQEYVSKQQIDSFRRLGNNWNDQFLVEQTNVTDTTVTAEARNLNLQLRTLAHKTWQRVALPHTAFPEPLVIVKPREGIAWYKKTFRLPEGNRGKSVSLYFEAAMQVADIWVNGTYITRHTGGYLPFVIDITKLVRFNADNTIYLKLNNKANPVVPPGKPVEKLDFIYYSGLYRSVWLDVKDPLHITDAVAAGQPAGGGIFVTYPQVNKAQATVQVQTHIINEYPRARRFTVEQLLLNERNQVTARAVSAGNNLVAAGAAHYEQQLTVVRPLLWHPDHPYRYRLKTIIRSGNKIVDERITPIGIRSFEITKERGLLINGEPFKITGTNRHQNYPYVGNALSGNASYRDAWLIKNAGMNAVRTGHYPPDPAFLEAADELGLLIINCIPGWQFFNRSAAFQDHVMEDIRQTIRRDRNHPSVLLWEVSLNESYPPAAFRCRQAEVARSEWKGTANFFTSGDSYFTKACWDVPYDDWNGDPGARNNTTYPDHPFLIREYGDYEFGGGNSTTRKLRGDGQDALLQQAWNLQWEHNKNQKNYPRAIGDLTWAFFDGLAGVVVGIEGWGVADIFRIPKFSYAFFQSQRDADRLTGAAIATGPMVSIAHYWQQANRWQTVTVYSNCDEVALYLDGKLIGRQKPDRGPETGYGTDFSNGGKPFDGGNANHLLHPPFTFRNISFAPGTLKAIGYIVGKVVASNQVSTAGPASKILLQVAENGKPLKAHTTDLVFIYAKITDEKGNLAVNATSAVTLEIKGNATLESPATVQAEAGIATFLVRTTEAAGRLDIKAHAAGLPGTVQRVF